MFVAYVNAFGSFIAHISKLFHSVSLTPIPRFCYVLFPFYHFFNYPNSGSTRFQAAAAGRLDECERLYRIKPDRLEIRDSKGRSVLHHAALNGHTNIIDFALDHTAGRQQYI